MNSVIGFDQLKLALQMFSKAIVLAKDGVILLPEGQAKTTFAHSVDAAARAHALAENQIAESLGYQLCRCTFPPQIMLSTGYNSEGHTESYRCPRCARVWPPEGPATYDFDTD
jgi:hypothetical protein